MSTFCCCFAPQRLVFALGFLWFYYIAGLLSTVSFVLRAGLSGLNIFSGYFIATYCYLSVCFMAVIMEFLNLTSKTAELAIQSSKLGHLLGALFVIESLSLTITPLSTYYHGSNSLYEYFAAYDLFAKADPMHDVLGFQTDDPPEPSFILGALETAGFLICWIIRMCLLIAVYNTYATSGERQWYQNPPNAGEQEFTPYGTQVQPYVGARNVANLPDNQYLFVPKQ